MSPTSCFAKLASILPLALIPDAASAQAIFFHVDGAPGDRQAYYSQTLVMDRTPAIS